MLMSSASEPSAPSSEPRASKPRRAPPLQALRRALSARLLRRGPRRRLVFFDFDRTLTTIHVFKSLAGWNDSDVCTVAAMVTLAHPSALTERGQLRLLKAIGPAWVEQAFGGVARVAVLRLLLGDLSREPGVTLVVVTRGYVAVARKCLSQAGLLEYFESIHGNIGSAYGEGTSFDVETQAQEVSEEERLFLGEEEEWDAKWQILFRYMREMNVDCDDVVLVDDDIDEIDSVSHAVRTVHVHGAAGITAQDVMSLLDTLELSDVAWAEKCLCRWSALRDPLASRPPAIVAFNRKHLSVRLSRHLACLEDEFKACKSALRRIKLLLRSPLLFYSVAHYLFGRELTSFAAKGAEGAEGGGKGGHRPTLGSSKTKELVALGMQSLGLMDGGAGADLAAAIPSLRRNDWGSMDNLRRGVSGGGASASSGPGRSLSPRRERGVSCASEASLVSGSPLHLYQPPAQQRMNSLVAQHKMLGSAVSMFRQAILGLCPITMATAGIRRNVICCHDARGAEPSVAVWSRYRQEAKLGAGHFGEVFMAIEVCSGREVAVKQLERLETDSAAGDDEETDRLSEVHTLRALAHPNLLRIYEVVQCAEYVHIVSEVASGGSLSAHLKSRGPGPWISGVMQQVSSAVAYCHRLHVLHGDLKPENVLLNGARPDGSPLCIVCDFGHATVCIGFARVAAPGDPRYIPPEVVNEEGLSTKSDVYMLGVTAFELLTGGWLPFFRAKAVTLQMSYCQLKFGGVREEILSARGLGWQDLERLKGSRPPPEAVAIVKGMLSREAAERPSALEVLRCSWLQTAAKPCKTAYDEMIKADMGGWGLWSPAHPRFAERLKARSKLSWTCRMLIGLIGSGLEPDRVHGARLLFRRLDEDGEGALCRATFVKEMRRAGIPEQDAQALFHAGDLHEQKFLDFKNIVTLFLDLEDFTRPQLLQQLSSVLNRLRGPPRPRIGGGGSAIFAANGVNGHAVNGVNGANGHTGVNGVNGCGVNGASQVNGLNGGGKHAHDIAADVSAGDAAEGRPGQKTSSIATTNGSGANGATKAAISEAGADGSQVVTLEELRMVLCHRPDARMERLYEDFRSLLSSSDSAEGELKKAKGLTPDMVVDVLLKDPFSRNSSS